MIAIDTRAFVIHSDTGTPVKECATHTEAANVAACLSRTLGLHHVVPFGDVVEDAVSEKVVA